MPKTMTLRLSDEQAAELDVVARVDEVSVAEAVRAAIDERIAARRADRTFQERLRRHMDAHREAFERLAR